MSKHGSPTDTIRAIMRGQINEAHGQPHIDPPYDVEAAVKVLHDNGVLSAKKVGDNKVSVSAADSFMADRVLTHSLNKGVIPAPVILVSDEAIEQQPDSSVPVTNPVSEEVGSVNDEGLFVRDLVNKKENQLKKIDEVSKGTLQSYVKKASEEGDHHHTAVHTKDPAKFKKSMNRLAGITKAVKKIDQAESVVSYVSGKIEQINELSKNTLRNYIVKAAAQHGYHSFAKGQASGLSHKETDSGEKGRLSTAKVKHGKEADKRFSGIAKAAHKLTKEEVELTEGKKENAEKAAKLFAAHPEADKMFQSMQHAAKTCNYITDAMDHVYNNHRENIKYGDWHNMKDHIEDHFRQRGLQG